MVYTPYVLSTDRPIAVDLFSGAGGLSLGLERAGYDVAAAVEFDPVHAAVHEFNFAYGVTFCADIRDISGRFIRENSGIKNREIDLVAGGPPCQGISLMGKRMIGDPRNELIGEFVRIVLELKPRYFVMENVPGLAVGDHAQLLRVAISTLRDGGYEVDEHAQTLQAADFGAPQSRKRLFLWGNRGGLDPVAAPLPSVVPRTLRGFPEEKSGTSLLPLGPSVSDALDALPDADLFPELLVQDSVIIEDFLPQSHWGKTLAGYIVNDSDWSRPRLSSSSILSSSLRTIHSAEVQKRFASTPPGSFEPISRFFRLHPEGISNTLRAGTGADRGSYTAPRPIHPKLARVVTVREAARLHGYPDWFRFHATKWHGLREVGNSVPIALGQAVGSAIMLADGISPRQGSAVHMGSEILLHQDSTMARAYFAGARPAVGVSTSW